MILDLAVDNVPVIPLRGSRSRAVAAFDKLDGHGLPRWNGPDAEPPGAREAAFASGMMVGSLAPPA